MPRNFLLLCCSAVPRNAAALRAALLKRRNYQCEALNLALLLGTVLLIIGVLVVLNIWLAI